MSEHATPQPVTLDESQSNDASASRIRVRHLVTVFVWLIAVAAVSPMVSQGSTTIRNAVLFGIGGWIVLSVLQALIGWIARGFAGIPRGHDHTPEPAPQSTDVSESL